MTEPYKAIPSPLKTHGGKGAFNGKLAQWIISLMPPHVHYVEPYFGGGSVLLYKDPEGISEVVNDIYEDLTNFWKILQEWYGYIDLQRILESTPFSSEEFYDAIEPKSMSAINKAAAFFIRCRQSMSGRMDCFSPLTKTRTRRGMNEQASAWITAIEGFPQVHERLRRVVILNADGVEVIKQQDGEQTLFYCDPPYIHETRTATSVYAYEMSVKQHTELLETLSSLKGNFLLSGYNSELYYSFAMKRQWNQHDFPTVNNAARGDTKRVMTETVWTNF